MAGTIKTYQNPVVLTRLLQAALVIQICAVLVFGTLVFLAAIGHEVIFESWLTFAIDDFVGHRLSYPLAVLLILQRMWVYRINANSHGLTPHVMKFSPGWSVGWWFIPIANLWQPFRIMSELYRVNETPAEWRTAKPPTVILIWWTLNIVIQASFVVIVLFFPSQTGASSIHGSVILFAIAIEQILAFYIYTRIASMQARAKSLGGVERVF